MTNSTSNLPLESHLLSLVSVELGHMWNEVLDDFSSPLDPTLSGLLEPKYYKHVLVCLGSVSFQPPTTTTAAFLTKFRSKVWAPGKGLFGWAIYFFSFGYLSDSSLFPSSCRHLKPSWFLFISSKLLPHGRPTAIAAQNSLSGKGTATTLYLLINEMFLSGFWVTRVSQEGSFMGLQAVHLPVSIDGKDPTLGLVIWCYHLKILIFWALGL